MSLLQRFLPALPYLFVFLYTLYVPTDPDLGWHLKNGEFFFQNGHIIRVNVYSQLMPGYVWANTSWLTDIITYGVYIIGGFVGLTILGSLLVALTFYFFSRVAKLTMWDQVFLFPLILYLAQPINAVSFRGQQVSLLFVGILFFLLSLYPKHKKALYLIIPLFLLWANLHGQFILGLALFGLWIVLYYLQSVLKQYLTSLRATKGAQQSHTVVLGLLRHPQMWFPRHAVKALRLFVIIFTGSLFATLVNPFGWEIHVTALSHFGSPLLQNIAEYLPFDMLSTSWWNQVMAGVLLIFGFIMLFIQKKVLTNLPLLGAGIILFLFSFEVRRYAWPAYYLILPLLTPLSAYLKPDDKQMTQILASIFALVLVVMGIVSKFPLTQFTSYSWDQYCVQIKCSPKAVEFLIKEDRTENIYTLYSWGGWLIWKYPEVKPVIDGRMHLWNQSGYSAFEEYYALEQNFTDIDRSEYNTVLISPDRPLYDRLIKLENAGKWKMVYNDPNASVFVRNK